MNVFVVTITIPGRTEIAGVYSNVEKAQEIQEELAGIPWVIRVDLLVAPMDQGLSVVLAMLQ